MGHVSSEEAQLKLQEAKEDLDLQDGGRWEVPWNSSTGGAPKCWLVYFKGKSIY